MHKKDNKKKVCINFSYFRFIKFKKECKMLLTNNKHFLTNCKKRLKEKINNKLV
jgi:hypothetical protein